MNTTELLEKMTALFADMAAENSKTSKAAHGRARKAAGELKKLLTEYKKASTAEDKAK
jgi:hypothetical protein